MRERRTDPVRRAQFEDRRLNLLDRLHTVCSYMSQEELDALTARMTRIRQKYDFVTAVAEA